MPRRTFNDIAKEIDSILDRVKQLEIPKAKIREQLRFLDDQRAALQARINDLEKDAKSLYAAARKKMLELSKLNPKKDSPRVESKLERDNK